MSARPFVRRSHCFLGLVIALPSGLLLPGVPEAAAAQGRSPGLPEQGRKLREAGKKLVAEKDLVEAESTYLEALRVYEEEAAECPHEAAVRLAECACRNDLAEIQGSLHRFAPARALLETNVALMQELAAWHPWEPALRFELARAHTIQANCHQQANLYLESVPHRRQAIRLLQGLAKAHPANVEYRDRLQQGQLSFAYELMKLARYAESEQTYRQAVAVAERLAAEFPDSPEYAEKYAEVCNACALLYRESGRFGEGVEWIRKAIVVLHKLEKEHPDQPHYWRWLPTYYRNLALPLACMFCRDEAAKAQAEAARLEVKLAGCKEGAGGLSDVDKIVGSLATLDARRFASQQGEVGNVIATGEDQARKHPDVPAFRVQLAGARLLKGMRALASGPPASAREEYLQARALLEKLASDFPGVPLYRSLTGEACVALGLAALGQGDSAAAQDYLRQGFAVLEKLAEEQPRVPQWRFALSNAHCRVVLFYQSRGNLKEASRYTASGLAVVARLAADFPRRTEYRRTHAHGYQALGGLYLQQQATAEAAFRQAVRLWEQVVADFPDLPTFRMSLGNAHLDLAACLANCQQPLLAEGCYREALRVHGELVKAFPDQPEYLSWLANDYCRFAQWLEARQRPAEALECYSKTQSSMEHALELRPGHRDWLNGLKVAYQQRGFLLLRMERHAEYEEDMRRMTEVAEMLDPTMIRLNRIRSRLEMGQSGLALKEANQLSATRELTGSEWCDLASAYAKLAEGAQDAGQKESAAARAVAALRKAIEAGHTTPQPLDADPRFGVLVGRDDFKQMQPSKAKP